MPKRNVPIEAVESEFRKDVSTKWSPKKKLNLPEDYEGAAEELAGWVGARWPNPDAGFFDLRDRLWQAVESWKTHNWERDKANIRAAKLEMQRNRAIIKSFDAFNASLSEAADEQILLGFTILNAVLTAHNALHVFYGALDLAQSDRLDLFRGSTILNTLVKGQPIILQQQEYASAVRRGLAAFRSELPYPGCVSRFGPLEYEVLPARCPEPKIAIAILLADIVTRDRKDLTEKQSKWDEAPPRVSANLPWRAIGLFADNLDASDTDLDFKGVQQRVNSHHKKVARLLRKPFTQ